MKHLLTILLTVMALVISGTDVMAQQLAFPGAEGYGRYATGGRGGEVCYVTRLDDCSDNALVQGTLRWALRHDNGGRPRTILFATAGTIYLTSKLKFQYPDVSILGQSAPGGGITITGYNMYVCKDNVIIRHIRFRAGDIPTSSMTGLDLENCKNVILDHCSMTWSMEECLTAYDSKNTTVQWCIIGEGLYNSKNAKGARAYATQWGGERSTMHHTLITNSHSRAPRFNGVRSPSNKKGDHDYQVDSEFANNVVFNWSGSGNQYGGEYDKDKVEVASWTKSDPGYDRVYIINNYYRPGPSTQLGTKSGRYWCAPSTPYGQWYLSGNKFELSSKFAPSSNIWSNAELEKVNADNYYGAQSGSSSRGINLTGSNFTKYVLSEIPYALSGMEYESADDAYAAVTTKAGASKPRYDEVDKRLLQEAAGTTDPKYHGSTIQDLGIIDSPANITLSYPDEYIADGVVHRDMPRMFIKDSDKYIIDSDADGMPDPYEVEKGLDKDDPSDGSADSGNGYTNLEVYLNSIADGVFPASRYVTSLRYVEPGPQTPDPETVTYTFSKGTATDTQGTAPDAITVNFGEYITIPVNHSLYRESYTLTQWSSGMDMAAPGAQYKSKRDVKLTPSFTANKFSLEQRTQDVTITWDFTADDAPASLSGSGIFVTQAVFSGESHDVKLSYADGKITIPACASATYSLVGDTTVEGIADGDALTIAAPENLQSVTITLPYIWNTPDRVYHSPEIADGDDSEWIYTSYETVPAMPWITASYLEYKDVRTFYDPEDDTNTRTTTMKCVKFNNSGWTYEMFVKGTKRLTAYLCHSNSKANSCSLYAYPADGGAPVSVSSATTIQKQQPVNLTLELDIDKAYRICLVTEDENDWAVGMVKLYGKEQEKPTSGTASVTWPWEGEFTADATITPKRIFTQASATLGSMLQTNGMAQNMKVLPKEKMLKIQSFNSTKEIDENSVITFTLQTAEGIAFRPERLSFNAIRCGTGSINYTVTVQQGNGNEVMVIDGKNPSRDNDDPATTPFRPDDIDLTQYSLPSSTEPLTIRMKLYNFFQNEGVPKDIAINKFTVSGTFEGKAPEVKRYTFFAEPSDPDAGTVTWTPSGTEFEENTVITVEAKAKAGYMFDHWTTATVPDASPSGAPATVPDASASGIYTLTLRANTTLTAHFNKIGEGEFFSDGPYQAIVSNAAQLAQALADAKQKTTADASLRYRIFLKNGIYDFGTTAKTAIPQRTSLIGESMEGVIIMNNPGTVSSNYQELTPVLFIDQNQNDVYLQDMTIRQARDWAAKKSQGQAIALRQRSKHAIYKKVSMEGVQDTYYLNKADGTAYFEDCQMAGEVDFIYGDGTMWFERCALLPVSSGAIITAPNTQAGYKGIIFHDCTIDRHPEAKDAVTGYALGRPWNDSPASTYLNTTMYVQPLAAGWKNMTAGLKVRFHEYGTKDADGKAVDLSQRSIAACNPADGSDAPVLTAEQAAAYTIDNVFGTWNPQQHTALLDAPDVALDGDNLTWTPVNGAYAYAICKDGSVIDFTTANTYPISSSGTYTIRVANQMGGLGSPSMNSITGIDIITANKTEDSPAYNTVGQRVSASSRGIIVKGKSKIVNRK